MLSFPNLLAVYLLFQRIARRGKKTFLSVQFKEIEENNRMGKTRDLFKKIRDDKPRQHVKKQRQHFADKSAFSKSYGFFSVVMYRCESWTTKKAECLRIDAFKLWRWRGLFRVPWTARRSNQSILKEINPEYSLEGLMLKLKLHYFGHLM